MCSVQIRLFRDWVIGEHDFQDPHHYIPNSVPTHGPPPHLSRLQSGAAVGLRNYCLWPLSAIGSNTPLLLGPVRVRSGKVNLLFPLPNFDQNLQPALGCLHPPPVGNFESVWQQLGHLARDPDGGYARMALACSLDSVLPGKPADSNHRLRSRARVTPSRRTGRSLRVCNQHGHHHPGTFQQENIECAQLAELYLSRQSGVYPAVLACLLLQPAQ